MVRPRRRVEEHGVITTALGREKYRRLEGPAVRSAGSVVAIELEDGPVAEALVGVEVERGNSRDLNATFDALGRREPDEGTDEHDGQADGFQRQRHDLSDSGGARIIGDEHRPLHAACYVAAQAG
jgi:hypothetical protein